MIGRIGDMLFSIYLGKIQWLLLVNFWGQVINLRGQILVSRTDDATLCALCCVLCVCSLCVVCVVGVQCVGVGVGLQNRQMNLPKIFRKNFLERIIPPFVLRKLRIGPFSIIYMIRIRFSGPVNKFRMDIRAHSNETPLKVDVSKRGCGKNVLDDCMFLCRMVSTLKWSRPEANVNSQLSCCRSVTLPRKCWTNQIPPCVV